MVQQHVERRLVAILCADVAGYTRLTGADEEGTIARLSALRRELVDPTIAAHRGRVVKRTGDGILIEFSSVVDALRCALDVQRGMMPRNASLAPEERIEFRVGINIGDVVVEGSDLLGDAVNVAARLEGIAKPGEIFLSEDAWRHVKDRVPATYVDEGEQNLKNVARPVRVYGVTPSAMLPPEERPSRAKDEVPRLSIVVLPFANLSGNSGEDYFADAVTEDITTDLSRIPGSLVIARNTAFTYKAKAIDVKQVGRELGVRYVLEGSVRRAGNRVRTNVQLIDAEVGGHLWAERFDCDRADLMELQDEITGRIASALGTQLIDAESRRSIREHATNPDAADLTMRGWSALHRPPTREALAEARTLFEEALALDARIADALIGGAYSYMRAAISGLTNAPGSDVVRAEALAGQALEVAPDRAAAHWVRGLVLKFERRYEEAVAAYERAIALDRNFAPAYGALADVLDYLDRHEDTVRLDEQAIRLSPRDPQLGNWQFDLGLAHWALGRLDEAEAWLRRARTTNPKLPFAALGLASIFALTGRMELARQEFAQMQQLAPWVTSVTALRARLPLVRGERNARREEEIYRGLRIAGLPE
ncbi:MAG TPA: adenylate/guanylate cyclase domain-containing protein [Stellaceae bacterium]|nr:adenylate/guanylate cyclase domain-containing protein [Stellaceae bacterium]